MGCHALLQGIFPTQGLNPHLLCLLHLVPPEVSNHSLTLLYIWATHYGVSQVALVVVNPPVNTGDVRNTCLAPGLGRSPGLGNGSHGQRSLVICSPWCLKELDTTERLHLHLHVLEKEMATYSSVLAWRIPGTVEPGGLPSMGSHRVKHD